MKLNSNILFISGKNIEISHPAHQAIIELGQALQDLGLKIEIAR